MEISNEQMEFAVFSIECTAEKLKTTGSVIYRKFTVESKILDEYIFPYYKALHTQGKEYIVNNLIDIMKQKSVIL